MPIGVIKNLTKFDFLPIVSQNKGNHIRAMAQSQIEQNYIEHYNRHSDEIFRYFAFRVYDRDIARELTQETFIKVWKYISSGKEVEYLKAFIYKTAYHLVVDYSRKKKETSLEALMEHGFDVEVSREKEEIKQDALAALQIIEKLSEKYQEVMKMRFIEGLSVQDIALALGLSENVVSVRIHRGKQQLEKYI
ncbi:MAG: hypothetical protein COV59_00675 [Candidatus Magasanikbacteria bacterium CG11_big_fil_rev_8_21_14_0_20_39_34]|uniref:RNA polymerase sigma factor n=1 Tax=Candidatus Magasanikbacteria bacterium CG11_big_fil_rev_8_21_14_0_20_39_34 TaxID=1974653 RepID=A0A2H0N8N8_9BACT|nr:MAG: hypothetical protein COV59_00675 [Candidatus Magasanikbacteria bacterium CG11_big_fil_rev_8_21_14_0_20_39_34]